MVSLQLSNEMMMQAFLELNKHALASGIMASQPEFGNILRQTMQRVFVFAQNAGPAPDRRGSDQVSEPDCGQTSLGNAKPHMEPEAGELAMQPSADMNRTVPLRVPLPAPGVSEPAQDLWTSYAASAYDLPTTPLLSTSDGSDGVGMSAQANELPEHDQRYRCVPGHVIASCNQPIQAREASQQNISSHALIPSPSHNLPPPRLASTPETTFARRLQRGACERFYRMASDPRVSSSTVQKYLGFIMHFGPPCGTTSVYRRNIVHKSDADPAAALGNWHWPLLHVGNAGLHFPPPENAHEPPPPPPGWSTPRSFGPWPLPKDAAIPLDDPKDFPEKVVDQAGFAGDWFDSRDVEAYLGRKGLVLRGEAAVAETDVEDPSDSRASVPRDEGSALAGPWERFLVGNHDIGEARTAAWRKGKRRISVDLDRLLDQLNLMPYVWAEHQAIGRQMWTRL